MISYTDILRDYKANSNVKHCFHPEKFNCSTNIIKAHSIQKERVLSQLEEVVNGNNLVYTLDEVTDNDFNISGLTPIGKKKASIFTGFCGYHDKDLFKNIEDRDFVGSIEQLYFFAYRAFAHGYHQLLESLKYWNSNSKIVRLYPRYYSNAQIAGINLRLSRIEKYKTILYESVVNSDYNVMSHHYRVIKPFIPLASCSILSPFYTYRNVFLNPAKHHSYVILNVIPDNDRTIIVLSNLKTDIVGRIFFDEFETLNDEEFTEAISSLILYCTTNTFFSPSFWNQIPDEMKYIIFNDLNYSVYQGDKIRSFFKSTFNFFKSY